MNLEEYYQEGAEIFNELLLRTARSLGEMQILKSDIIKKNLFADPDEKDEIILLIDEIIWEEIHAANQCRSERKGHILAIANLARSIQEREAGPDNLSRGRPDNLVNGMAERARPGTPLPLFPEIQNPHD